MSAPVAIPRAASPIASPLVTFCALLALGSCRAAPEEMRLLERPALAPERPSSAGPSIPLSNADLVPMYRELMAIDLPAVVSLATSGNLEIQAARLRVEQRLALLESSGRVALPILAPAFSYEQVDGSVRATEGNLVDVAFRTFQPYVLLQWIANPGKVHYEIVAARKRLLASEHEERAVVLQTLRRAALQYYDLLRASHAVSAAREALAEARELARVAQSGVLAGTALGADEMRARAEAAAREQDLTLALQSFHDTSLALALTLHLEPTVTLAPSEPTLAPVSLVRDDLAVEDLLVIAVLHRDDLRSLRALIEASVAELKGLRWSSFGPRLEAGYQLGGIAGSAEDVAGEGDQDFGLRTQERINASAGWRLSLAAFSDLAAAGAIEEQSRIAAERRLAEARSEVVAADQASRASAALAEQARVGLRFAEEALRLARANLQAGAMTQLDVLHAQSALAQARLRYAGAVVSYNQAQVELLGALGVLDAEGLLGLHADRDAMARER